MVHEDDSAVSNVVQNKVKSLYLAYLFDRLPNTNINVNLNRLLLDKWLGGQVVLIPISTLSDGFCANTSCSKFTPVIIGWLLQFCVQNFACKILRARFLAGWNWQQWAGCLWGLKILFAQNVRSKHKNYNVSSSSSYIIHYSCNACDLWRKSFCSSCLSVLIEFRKARHPKAL